MVQDELFQVHVLRFSTLKPPLQRPWDTSGSVCVWERTDVSLRWCFVDRAYGLLCRVGLLNPSTFKQEMRQFKKELSGDACVRLLCPSLPMYFHHPHHMVCFGSPSSLVCVMGGYRPRKGRASRRAAARKAVSRRR